MTETGVTIGFPAAFSVRSGKRGNSLFFFISGSLIFNVEALLQVLTHLGRQFLF